MKKGFPTIFRTTKHQQFSYSPRFYDPVKEDIDNRTALIASELKQQRRINLRAGRVENENPEGYQSRISLAYQRKERLEKRSFMTQLLIVAILLGLISAFLSF